MKNIILTTTAGLFALVAVLAWQSNGQNQPSTACGGGGTNSLNFACSGSTNLVNLACGGSCTNKVLTLACGTSCTNKVTALACGGTNSVTLALAGF